jgi:FkbM family methyltransferase
VGIAANPVPRCMLRAMLRMSRLESLVVRASPRRIASVTLAGASRIVPLSVWSRLESFAARQLGKGTPIDRLEAEVACCAKLLKRPPRTVLDIGANRGDYSAAVVARYPDCSLHAFEPSPVNATLLRERFKGNPRVRIHEVALSDNDGEACLYADRPGSGLASLSERRLDHFGIRLTESVQVRTARLDKFAKHADICEIDWVKLDVEGHELFVLQGMGSLLDSFALVQFEFGGCNIDSRTFFQDFFYLFTRLNFTIYRLTPRGPAPIDRYDEMHETFRTTNFVALRRAASPVEVG